MTTIDASRWIWLMSKRKKKKRFGQTKNCTVGLRHVSAVDNLLSWTSAQSTEKTDSIACYNAKRIPLLMPLPGSHRGDCPDMSTCFAICAMHMAQKLDEWSSNSQICPYRIKRMTAMPPVVCKLDKLIFLFCVARGAELEYVTQGNTTTMTDVVRLVKCSNDTWYPATNGGNATTMKNVWIQPSKPGRWGRERTVSQRGSHHKAGGLND